MTFFKIAFPFLSYFALLKMWTEVKFRSMVWNLGFFIVIRLKSEFQLSKIT